MLYYDRTHSSLLILPPFHRSPCSAPFFATTCCNYSSCASSSCFSSSCATCQAYSTMSWTGRELTMRHDIGNEIKDEEGHDNRGIGDEKCEERQSQRPIAGVAEQTPLPQPSSRVGSSPLSQLSLPAVPTTLRTAGKEARSMLSSSGSPPSAALPPSPLFSIVPITDSSSESNPQLHKDASSVLVPQVSPHSLSFSPGSLHASFLQWLVAFKHRLLLPLLIPTSTFLPLAHGLQVHALGTSDWSTHLLLLQPNRLHGRCSVRICARQGEQRWKKGRKRRE